VTSDDQLDAEKRERIRAFERRERVERLGWVIAAVLAAGFVLISPWRWWLLLALAVWWLVGFLLVRTEEESLGHRLLYAPLAPLALLFFAPLLLPGKDAWTGRRIQTQLERIAAESVRANPVVDGNVIIHDFRPGEANFNWWGDAKVALQRLRGVPDNTGRDGLWNAFPEKTHSSSRDLAVELERICGEPNFPVMFGVPGQNGALRIIDRTVFDDTPSPEFEWEWEGTTEEAIERLRLVPDGAGRDGIWGAFPDKVWASPR
jgi:hypothetical protein